MEERIEGIFGEIEGLGGGNLRGYEGEKGKEEEIGVFMDWNGGLNWL